MGRLMYDSLLGRDYPIVSAINLIMAILVIFTNLFVDVTYGWLGSQDSLPIEESTGWSAFYDNKYWNRPAGEKG